MSVSEGLTCIVSEGPKRTYAPRRTLTQKLDSLFDFLAGPGMRWTIGDLMFNLFRLKDDTFSPSARHGQYAEKFLSGKRQHHPGMVLNAWVHSPYGVIAKGSTEEKLMFSLDVDYQDITSIRPACLHLQPRQ